MVTNDCYSAVGLELQFVQVVFGPCQQSRMLRIDVAQKVVAPSLWKAFLWTSELAIWIRTAKACKTMESMNCVFVPVEFLLGHKTFPMEMAGLNCTLKRAGVLVHMLPKERELIRKDPRHQMGTKYLRLHGAVMKELTLDRIGGQRLCRSLSRGIAVS